jgi:peptidoglycan hydrolase-like protein with peptidoglycan-binding domain
MTDETSGERLEPPTNTVKMGTGDPDTVRAIQRRLNALGCGPVREDGAFGPQTATAVRLFQARFTDSDGSRSMARSAR